MARLRKGDKAYDAADVVITLLGNSPNEVTEISYGVEQEHQHNYSIGSNDPSSWSMGKRTPSGSMTMSMREVVAIEGSIQGDDKDLLKVAPFHTYTTYANEYNQIVTDKVLWKFASTGREVQAGNMGLGKQFNMFVLDVQHNIA